MKQLITKYKYYIAGILVVLIGWLIINFLVAKNAEIHKKLEVATYNLKVTQDSLRITKDLAGKQEYNKLAYLTDKVTDLAKINQDLATEVRAIKGKVGTIIQGDVKIVEKPVPFEVKAQLVDSNIVARFKYDTTYSLGNFRKLSGYTSYDLRTGKVSGQKEQDEIGVKVVTGIKNLDKNKPEIFFKSDYPGLQVTEVQGAVLDPSLFKGKDNTPLLTPVISIAWTPLTYTSNSKAFDFNLNKFSIGAGVGINIFKLLKLKK